MATTIRHFPFGFLRLSNRVSALDQKHTAPISKLAHVERIRTQTVLPSHMQDDQYICVLHRLMRHSPRSRQLRVAAVDPEKMPRPKGEEYIPGYQDSVLQYQMSRTAKKQGGFALPLIQPGDSVLDCGCGPGSISLGFVKEWAPREGWLG
jgi:hypothetical protein